jgi:hypothetical protein
MSELKIIIDKTSKSPTIINENSNFVIVTYWWGRGNLNGNTSRPCISFYESYIQKVIKYCIDILNNTNKNDIEKSVNKLPFIVMNLKTFKSFIENISTQYQNMIYEYCNISKNDNNKDDKAFKYLEKLKEYGKTPQTYEYKTFNIIKERLIIITLLFINENKKFIFQLFYINEEISKLKSNFLNEDNEIKSEDLKNKYKNQISDLLKTSNEIKTNIKKALNTPFIYQNIEGITTRENFNLNEFNNKSIYNLLHNEFRFLSPLLFEDMISLWESKCSEHKCNFLSIEYPEFAKPGGYQLAINAKPLFIEKSLELCKNRNVLYIDGDMFIRKYPEIFDLTDVDFMARGWSIDPRSSYRLTESITYDPYTFETSGGTMFFSQSNESKSLINKWIEESAKSYQNGKADDRILSLVFNTYKFLLNMKIIQLPIEYLWLTLDYDDRMMEFVYDYDSFKMKESIYIEHSECLTTEDTASGAGASNDRTPKFYAFIEDSISPVSETVHEYVMFPTKQMTESFKDYFNFMKNTQYIDDGNTILYEKEFVDIDNPENNESPLYVIDYDDKYGNKKNINVNNNKLSHNDISEINLRLVNNIDLNNFDLINTNNIIEIQNKDNLIKNEDLLPLIIKLLQENHKVIYNPINSEGYDPAFYEILIENKDTLYKSIEFIFVPNIVTFNSQDIYKPLIHTNQVMSFSPNKILIDLLLMMSDINMLSNYINYGTYEFISRLRIGYIIKKIKKTQKGGNGNMINFEDDYLKGLNIMYNEQTGGKMKKYKKRFIKKTHKKRFVKKTHKKRFVKKTHKRYK